MDQDRLANVPASIGSYVFLDRLSSGAYGDVYVAEHKMTKQKVAIKIMNRAFLVEQDAFISLEQEIRIQQTLDHPNIVKIYDILYSPDYVFVVLEYCQQGDLLESIQSGHLRSQRQARMYFYQILLAVQYIHHRKIAHLDLKPENILVFDDMTVKLADFGCCEAPPHKQYRCTRGTLYYAAPEMLVKPQKDNRPADIWSLGILFFSMINSSLPFRPGDDDFVRQQIISGEIVIPPHIPSEISTFIQWMCQLNPDNRPSIDEAVQSRLFAEFAKDKPSISSSTSASVMNTQHIGGVNISAHNSLAGLSTYGIPNKLSVPVLPNRRKSLIVKPAQTQANMSSNQANNKNNPILKAGINNVKSMRSFHVSFG
ncbi:CAMK family protein kinase [Tritrichomonas foetus]|uniref:CAMK family protein kinase n=1 Tax=Tritrichomonas foetus TaxID=1144522 RepID=A0A1J4JNE7_9EUKA|nr:CAMK family protein kinase [Tritrichomonas foetus]|eukprot:OHT00226.1 CAMK family protein kinase [Tritrichomonas foetus]